MAYRTTPKLAFPLENSDAISSNFGTLHTFDGEDWGMHLGVDLGVQAGTQVFSIGRGVVVYAAIHPGVMSDDGKIKKRNWGGIVIVAHKNPATKSNFFSVYGHLGKCLVKKGDAVELGTVIGVIGKAMSPENGLWEDEHLHFGIYSGPFNGKVLPGYFKKDNETTRPEYWQEPLSFVKNYGA